MDAVLGIFAFILIATIAAVLFFAWLFYITLRMLLRGAGRVRDLMPLGHPPGPRLLYTRCPYQDCAETNPAGANFCRRCGRRMFEAQRVAARRVRAA
jgi:hypothetical protein